MTDRFWEAEPFGIPAPRLSSSEPLSALARVPVLECGEPLIDFLRACPRLVLDRPRYGYVRAILLRSGVVARLCQAAAALPPEYRLSIIEGWRDPEFQRVQYRKTEEDIRREYPDLGKKAFRRMVNRYSAPPDGPAPAPHTTGGAVDVWLCDAAGTPLDLWSPYDAHDRRSYRLYVPGLAPETHRRRRVLAHAMAGAGFTNYPCEYWHWSYGDQGWAYRGRHPHAFYGAVER